MGIHNIDGLCASLLKATIFAIQIIVSTIQCGFYTKFKKSLNCLINVSISH